MAANKLSFAEGVLINRLSVLESKNDYFHLVNWSWYL